MNDMFIADLRADASQDDISKYKKFKIFQCKHCGQYQVWETNKKRIKSYCETSGKNTYLKLLEEQSK